MKKWMLFIAVLFLIGACDTPKALKAGSAIVDHIDQNTIHMVDGRKVKIPGFGDADQVTFFMVRHAEKLPDGSNPKLSEVGTARAKKLAKILKKVPMDRIFSTDYHRTRDTAGPLSKIQDRAITVYPPREQAKFFVDYVHTQKGTNALVVGHSNTIPDLINKIIGALKYETLAHEAYDNLYIVCQKGSNKAEVMELKY